MQRKLCEREPRERRLSRLLRGQQHGKKPASKKHGKKQPKRKPCIRRSRKRKLLYREYHRRGLPGRRNCGNESYRRRRRKSEKHKKQRRVRNGRQGRRLRERSDELNIPKTGKHERNKRLRNGRLEILLREQSNKHKRQSYLPPQPTTNLLPQAALPLQRSQRRNHLALPPPASSATKKATSPASAPKSVMKSPLRRAPVLRRPRRLSLCPRSRQRRCLALRPPALPARKVTLPATAPRSVLSLLPMV
ncbi:hypothetical protein EJ02DRAFT_72346 [Clathrospora elynae]|uniref:Uncharacterized protein n=1 Tax=Clathrospora elynae TaxID=706981 RepID=A0A6A5SYG8_9PLEO|nr:hypothetical protein EJ02DRAFT_72346 [Clathrospora elynae]